MSKSIFTTRLTIVLNLIKNKKFQFNRNLSKHTYNSESDAEKWRRVISANDSGSVSCFEDDEGNLLLPTGQLTNSMPLRQIKSKSVDEKKTHFVDCIKVTFRGGNGGDGCISFLHLFNNANAGPDGGDGGNGGHVILVANSQVKSLCNLQTLFIAENGVRGMGKCMFGKTGEHRYVEVPIGTIIKDQDGKVLAELYCDQAKYIAARGGAGGKGNHFYLTNENRHPRLAEKGAKGENKQLILEMRTIAHAGFVGFPNAGKSTLLRAISRARPRVASYPFTTLHPHIGVVHYDDLTQLAVADLPGLIEGASKNKGLGIAFLKHLEKCVCLLYVIDLSATEPNVQFDTLKAELEEYRKGLSKRPHAIIGNKYDLPEAKMNLPKLIEHIKRTTPENEVPLPVIPVSGKKGDNLLELLKHLRGLYDLYNKPEKLSDDEQLNDVDFDINKGFVW